MTYRSTAPPTTTTTRTLPTRFTFDGAGVLATAPPGSPTMEITALYVDSPAAAAGLLPGDQITAIDDRPFADIGLARAWQLFRTGSSSTHRLLVHRDGHHQTIDIVLRERI